MSALPEDEAKEFHRLISALPGGAKAVAQRIAPRTSISQLSVGERLSLRDWMLEQINGPGDGQQAS